MTTSDRMAKLQTDLLPREDALKKFKEFDGCKEETVGGGAKVKFTSFDDTHVIMEHNKEEYKVGKEGFEKLCRIVGIPATYVEKTPWSLFYPHLQHWLTDKGMVVKYIQKTNSVDKDGRKKVVSFMKEGASFYPVNNVLRIADKFGTDYVVESASEVTWRDASFGIVFPKHEFEIKDKVSKGDYVYGGMKVKYSPIGEFPFKMSAFFMTLVCMNGMISANEIYKFSKKSAINGEDEFIEQSFKTGLDVLGVEVGRIQALKDVKLTDGEHIVSYIHAMFDRAGMGHKSRTLILERIQTAAPTDLYGLMNAVTAASHDVEENHRADVYDIQALGGDLVNHASTCGTCHRPM